MSALSYSCGHGEFEYVICFIVVALGYACHAFLEIVSKLYISQFANLWQKV